MTAENEEFREELAQADERVGHSFDELAKGLADHTLSRHDVLKLVGGVLAGGLLASVPGIAWARGHSRHHKGHRNGASSAKANGNKGGNSDCAHFCHTVFPDDDNLAGKCTSAAARDVAGNLCKICNANPENVCGTGKSATCCSEGQTCQDGQCVENNVCSPGQFCGTSPAGPLCFCRQRADGTGTVCVVPSNCANDCSQCDANRPICAQPLFPGECPTELFGSNPVTCNNLCQNFGA